MKHEKTPGKGLSGKLVALLLALTLVIGCVAGGTVAWLTANGGTVTNTFTFGDINIKLTESENLDLKVVPGKTIAKDPKVTVLANSEACWLFVTVKAENWNDKLTYDIATGWTELTDTGIADGTKVYWRKVDATTTADSEPIYILAGEGEGDLKNGVVNVSTDLTKTEVDAMNGKKPTLTFTAYAVQQDGIENVADAWAKISPATPTP